MPTLSIHNPVIHKDPQTYSKTEVGFTSMDKCPEKAREQVITAIPPIAVPVLLNLTSAWVHYRPSRVGPVLCLPAAKGNRKVTVMVWLEQAEPAKQEPSQIFTSAELAHIKELVEQELPSYRTQALHAKVTELLKETK